MDHYVFRICNNSALNTLSSQASYHKLGRVLNSPPHNVKCNMLIMRACGKDVMGSKVTVKSGVNLEGVEQIVKRLGSKKYFNN